MGNIRTFIVNHLLARQRGWRVLMRVEDLDGPRVKQGVSEQMLDDLAWLGLTWEQPVMYQSDRGEQYQAALQQLIDAGEAYPCVCSRKDIEQAATAPHREDAQVAYPGTCYLRFENAEEAGKLTGRPVAWRARVTSDPVEVNDEFLGAHEFDLSQTCGDIVVVKNDGLAAYQLAVVVDDATAGVDAIVRGDDLLESAARQIHLRRLLGLRPEPEYWHLPLVIGSDGLRLAKRHGNTRLSHYRQLGATPERILGLMGYWCGLLDKPEETDVERLLNAFDMARLPRDPAVFTQAENDFLLGR